MICYKLHVQISPYLECHITLEMPNNVYFEKYLNAKFT